MSHWHYNDVTMSILMSQINRVSDSLFNRSFRLTSKKISKPASPALCEGNAPLTDGFPSQRANNTETVSIWWYHDGLTVSWWDCTDLCATMHHSLIRILLHLCRNNINETMFPCTADWLLTFKYRKVNPVTKSLYRFMLHYFRTKYWMTFTEETILPIWYY